MAGRLSLVKKCLITILLFFALIIITYNFLNLKILIPKSLTYVYLLFSGYIILNLIQSIFFLNSYFWRDLDWKIPKGTKDSKLSDLLNNSMIYGIFKVLHKIKEYLEIFVHYFIFVNVIIHTFPGYLHSKKNSENITQPTHDAIALCGKNSRFKIYYGLGFSYLISFFKKYNYSYKIYSCNSCEDFEKVMNNPSGISVWIFGHGDHGSVGFGDLFYEYSQLKGKSIKKDYIYQFHCNPGSYESLASIVSDGKGYVNNDFNTPNSNYWNIYEILRSFDYDNNRVKSD